MSERNDEEVKQEMEANPFSGTLSRRPGGMNVRYRRDDRRDSRDGRAGEVVLLPR